MRDYWKIAGGFGAAIFATSFLLHPPLNSQDWASWIGAIGTVGTLVGTLWLAANERGERRRLQSTVTLLTADVKIHTIHSNLEIIHGVRSMVSLPHESPYDDVSSLQVQFDTSKELLNRFQFFSKGELVELAALSRKAAFDLGRAESVIRNVHTLLDASEKIYTDFKIAWIVEVMARVHGELETAEGMITFALPPLQAELDKLGAQTLGTH